MQQELFDKLSIEDKILQTKKIIAERQRIEEIKKEEKLLSKPMQQLLPEIFEEKRAIPNCFLRGALFGMVRKGKRSLVENKKIFTMSQYEVFFSGSELDQNDLELWDTLIYLAKQRKVVDELKITLYDLCQQMRLSPTKKTYQRLIDRAKRLQFGQVNIKANQKEFVGSLINNVHMDSSGDGKLVIEYNKKLYPLFIDNDYTLISSDIRHLIGGNQLARWIYNFYESHSKPIPFEIEFIKKLCRSSNTEKDFKYKLKIALELIRKANFATNAKSTWDYEITKNNFLIIHKNGKK